TSIAVGVSVGPSRLPTTSGADETLIGWGRSMLGRHIRGQVALISAPLIWQVDVAAMRIADCWDFLDSQERLRADGCVKQADRTVFVATRAALRCALASITHVDPKSFHFEAGPWGKPFIAAPTGLATLQFSVAHSGSVALITVAPLRRIGIDLERSRQVE